MKSGTNGAFHVYKLNVAVQYLSAVPFPNIGES